MHDIVASMPKLITLPDVGAVRVQVATYAMTHDYKRNGTSTLFAAMSILDGTVISRCKQCHRRVEWLD